MKNRSGRTGVDRGGMRSLAVVGGVFAALVLAGVAGADGTPLKASVGPGFAISLKDAGGVPVVHLDPGAYSLEANDLGDNHSFHLTGPGGVDVGTTVEGIGQQTFAVTVVDGTYKFFCDAHPLQMKGSFTVGTATSPPPPSSPPPSSPPPVVRTKLSLTVTDKAVTLRTAAGAVARTLAAGAFSIKVVDRSKKQNAHVVGAGVNRKTGIVFVGTVTWKVTLKTGTLVYRSDTAKPKLRGGKATVK